MLDDIERRAWTSTFMANVDQRTNGCWIWTGHVGKNGYGWMTCDPPLANRAGWESAHRLAWLLFRGGIPRGQQVNHKCDTPLCVCPDHLFVGTQADNLRDMTAKGRRARGDRHGQYTKPERMPRGTKHGMSKITEQDVAEMRKLYAAGGISQPELACKYGITQAAVWFILARRTWKHVP